MSTAPRKTGRGKSARAAAPPAKASLALPRELTIYSVGELRPQWLEHLGSDVADETMDADGAAVEEVDAAGVQLLVSLSRALQQDQRRLHVRQPSAALAAACAALGTLSLLDGATTGKSA